MLLQLNKVTDHGIYGLHRDVIQFFYNSIAQTVYNKNLLFTDNLRNVVNSAPDLEKLFKKVFKELNENAINKQLIYDEIIRSNNVESILSDENYPARFLEDAMYLELNKAISGLYKHLWKSTIKTGSCNTNFGSLKDHYTQFVQLNKPLTQRICAFCGLKKLENPNEKINSYDHYLNQKDYPFLRINFNNLVPMCDTCNERPNKGTTDMIFDDLDARRVAFYPFDQVLTINIVIVSNGVIDFLQWTARADCNIIDQRFITWKTVFKIDARYTNYLRDLYQKYITNLHQFMMLNTFPTNAVELIATINDFRAYREGCAMEEGDFIEFVFLSSLVTLPVNELDILFKFLVQRNQMLTG